MAVKFATKKARFCPFMYFKVPKRTKKWEIRRLFPNLSHCARKRLQKCSTFNLAKSIKLLIFGKLYKQNFSYFILAHTLWLCFPVHQDIVSAVEIPIIVVYIAYSFLFSFKIAFT